MELEDYQVTGKPHSNKVLHTATLRITNKNEQTPVQVRAVDFLIDFGPSDAPSGTLEVASEEGFKSTTGTTLVPGETQIFRFKVSSKKRIHPVELVWWAPPKTRLALSLI
jgi:dihydrodipicolinate reductase